MRISEILKKKEVTFSLEVFPPKTSEKYSETAANALEIARLKPDFMSVTYGAGGGTGEFTTGIAADIQKTYGVPTLAHLTCVSSTRAHVLNMLELYRQNGIENILALRGDIPKELENADRTGWAYHHAVELVRELKEADPELCIGGACYPEIHPESKNGREDIFYLKEKVDAGCDFLTTQMFFDNNLLYSFLYKIRESGITVPVVPGIMPITKATQVDRAIKLSGSFMPRRFISLVDRFGGDPAAMKQAGIAYATDQIIDLYANGIKNVHVYTMNNPDVAEKIMANLSDIIGK